MIRSGNPLALLLFRACLEGLSSLLLDHVTTMFLTLRRAMCSVKNMVHFIRCVLVLAPRNLLIQSSNTIVWNSVRTPNAFLHPVSKPKGTRGLIPPSLGNFLGPVCKQKNASRS
uniref:Putative secreted protein n=1 Tax=Ixodes ricinus TaxID=34613 RepID=A0A6B0UKP3_IXORI